MTNQSDHASSLSVILGRVFWMMLGPLLLVVLAYQVYRTAPDGWLTPADFSFLGVLALLVIVRCLEFRGDNPLKATGEPATKQDLRRYVMGAVILGLLAWIGANLVGQYWINR